MMEFAKYIGPYQSHIILTILIVIANNDLFSFMLNFEADRSIPLCDVGKYPCISEIYGIRSHCYLA